MAGPAAGLVPVENDPNSDLSSAKYCIAFAILPPVQAPLAIGTGMIPFAAPSSGPERRGRGS